MQYKFFTLGLCLAVSGCALDKKDSGSVSPAPAKASPVVFKQEIPKTLDWLVQNSPSDINSEGQTLVHRVVKESRVDLLKQLMQNKIFAFLNIPDQYGRTPLHYARAPEIASLLVDLAIISRDQHHNQVTREADDYPDHDGNTPLHSMAEAGSYSVVGYMVGRLCAEGVSFWSRQFRINMRNTVMRQTPLQMALLKGDLLTVTALLTCPNVEISNADSFGHTPLHYAARLNSEEAVGLLLIKMETRGDMTALSARDELEETPLFIAHRCASEKVQWQLRNAGAELDSVNKWHQRPEEVSLEGYTQSSTDSYCGKAR